MTAIRVDRGGRRRRLRQRVAAGAGLVKAAAGVDQAADEDVSARWEACMACEHHDRGKCTACGCFVGAKIRQAGAECPVDRWRNAEECPPAPSG